jgi:glycosyltransferase involved in cell wall biosynthesis
VKVAIVVDWLTDSGGAEQVFSEAMKVFPDASLHALVDQMSDADHARLGLPRARTSWLQALVGERGNYRKWLPMMPGAIRSLQLEGADLVLAISHSVAIRAPVRDGQKLLCLSLSPMRYAWDLRAQYLREAGLNTGVAGMAANLLLDQLRDTDRRASARVDHFAAISKYIAARVKKAYERDSEIIYPPVDTEFYTAHPQPLSAQPYYVTASRFVPYKRIDLIVQAFERDPSRRLVVIGDGPENAKVRAAANRQRNIEFVGHAQRDELRHWLRGAKGFVFAADEDFGIAPVEAQACGTPVIAYGRGGALETVQDGVTGVFFQEQTVESIREAIERFEQATFSPANCRSSAERFAAPKFREALAAWVARSR